MRFGALGDMILTTPLLRALAERHGQPCEVVGRGDFIADIFANLPFVWSIRAIESNKTPYYFNHPKKMLVEWLQNRAKGPVYLVQSDVLSHMTLSRAGIVAEASDLTVERRVNEHVVDHMARMGGFVDQSGNVRPDYNRGTELRVSHRGEGTSSEMDGASAVRWPGYRGDPARIPEVYEQEAADSQREILAGNPMDPFDPGNTEYLV